MFLKGKFVFSAVVKDHGARGFLLDEIKHLGYTPTLNKNTITVIYIGDNADPLFNLFELFPNYKIEFTS